MIRTVFIISYLYGVLPIIIGVAAVLLSKHRYSFPFIYTSGYVIYLALFELVTAWEEHKAVSYIHFVRYWKTSVYVVTFAALLCVILFTVLRIKKQGKTEVKTGTFRLNHLDQKAFCTLIASIILIFFAVLFLVPHAYDQTPELARLSISRNVFFSTDPSTGSAYTEISACPGCLHLFYAFGSTITGVDVTTLIHLVMPVFMLPFFICTYLIIARLLFPDKKRKETRYHFIWLVLVFYLLFLPLKAHIALVPYRNIWNGTTLAASCLFPLFFTVCIDLIRCVIKKSYSSIPELTMSIITLICLGLAIKLSVRFGLIICLLFTLASIICIVFLHVIKQQTGTKALKGGRQL